MVSRIRFLAIVPLAIALSSPAQATSPAVPEPAAKGPAFEVVSVRLNKSGDSKMAWWPTAIGFESRNISLRQLVVCAYDLRFSNEVAGLPPWTDTERFDVNAKMDEDAAAPFQKLNPQQQWKQIQLMLQSLLAERFALKAHREPRELPVYDLTLAKGGTKLTVSHAAQPVYRAKGHGQIDFEKAQIWDLIYGLSSDPDVDRPIVDKTDLTGRYDMQLKWTPNASQGETDQSLSIFTALEEQLGLKLVAAKAPVDVLVIDHIEQPSEN
jgi:uncharacterized protein (TIGR03435 family)